MTDTTNHPTARDLISTCGYELVQTQRNLLRSCVEDGVGAGAWDLPIYIVEALGEIASVARRLDYIQYLFEEGAPREASEPFDVALGDLLGEMEKEGRR